MAAAPMIRMPVPKKKEDAIEIPKYFLKITFRNVYKLAHPKLIIIFPKTAQTKDSTFTSKGILTNKPAATAPSKYVIHIHAIANAQVIVLDII